MPQMQMPTYYEIRLPDGKDAFVHLDDVLRDKALRGEVIASLLAQAEVNELKAAEQRAIAKMLERLATKAGPAAE
jgi:hypothetical protein